MKSVIKKKYEDRINVIDSQISAFEAERAENRDNTKLYLELCSKIRELAIVRGIMEEFLADLRCLKGR